MYLKIIKPSFDFALSLMILLLLSPIFLTILILLTLYNNGTPFFTQHRPGKNGIIFKIIKFKTMNNNKDSKGNLLPDSKRLTPIGNFARQTSLDELPQLINVLKGDMSLIGPRPLLIEYLSLYNDLQKLRHNVKPGITGWAQVNGRNAISWRKKFEYDIFYVENISLSLDVIIFLKTAYNVFTRGGIYKDSDIASMEAFNGKN